jgi:hypothetical protein
MNAQDHSIKALVDITMTFFPECAINSRPDLLASLQNVVEKYLLWSNPYEMARDIVQSLLGISQPIEQLRVILDTGRHKTRQWSPYEDRRLLCGIYRHGIENWTAISQFVGNARTRSQCSQRWYRGLDPTLSKFPWSKKEEDRLIALITQLGLRSWTAIAARMGNRSDVQCRSKYKQLQKERAKIGEVIAPPCTGQIRPFEHAHGKPGAARLRASQTRALPPLPQLPAVCSCYAPPVMMTTAPPFAMERPVQPPVGAAAEPTAAAFTARGATEKSLPPLIIRRGNDPKFN